MEEIILQYSFPAILVWILLGVVFTLIYLEREDKKDELEYAEHKRKKKKKKR